MGLQVGAAHPGMAQSQVSARAGLTGDLASSPHSAIDLLGDLGQIPAPP